MELLRRSLAKKQSIEDFEENLVKSIVLIAKEMGWTIDYVMGMGILQFISVSEVINDFYEKQNRDMQLQSMQNGLR